MQFVLLTFISGMTLLNPLVALAGQMETNIEVSFQESLLDEEITIKFSQLIPHETIKIQAQTIDDNEVQWTSFGLFEADDLGEINLAEQASIQGSYDGVDAMGLFWSMNSATNAPFKIKKDHFLVTITAYRGVEKIASRELIRLRKAPNVEKIFVQENGLNGILFFPAAEKPLPIIITLSGSNGGYGENRAQLLASNGFAVLALAYFGVEELPPNLQDIPLEYFETAFAWIKKQPQIDSYRVGIYGVSRGAELALILGSLFPQSVQAIAAVVPSSVVYGGLSETPVNAWLYRGQAVLPFAPVPKTNFSGETGKDPAHPASIVQNFLDGMKDQMAFKAAAIPVEKIQASLLLISGGDDQMWPSSLYAAQIQQRLKENNSTIICQHLHYPKAGHGINIPNIPQPGPVYFHPISKLWFSMGGSAAEDQYASQDSWKNIILFFQTSLFDDNS